MSTGYADTIFRGGWIWPGADGPRGTPPPPFPGSVAVRGGRILAVGAREEVEALLGPRTRVDELEGAFVTPGWHDAHLHFLTGGFKLDGVDLRHADSRDAFVTAVEARAGELPPGTWILGGDWDQERWGGPLPHRDWIDPVTPHHPVVLNRMDMHMALANSRALEAAGIDEESPDPPHGRVDREDASTRPTGILREAAIERVWASVPEPDEAAWRRALQRATEHALNRGVTQVHDMGMMERKEWTWTALSFLRRMRREGRLAVRIRGTLPITDWERAGELVREEGSGDEFLSWGAVKGFADGSLGARTAWFHDPYEDDPGTGGPVMDPDALEEAVRASVGAGLQPVIHAIGDRANDWVVGLYHQLLDDLGADPERPPSSGVFPFRVEHAQHLTPRALSLVARKGLVFSAQPAHLVEDGVWMRRALGGEREGRAYPFRTLLERGARLAFGSDWTVTPLDPRRGLAAAVGRRVRAGRGLGPVWSSQERIGLPEALRAYTSGAAYAGGEWAGTGRLEVGAPADLTVLERNPFEQSPDELEDVDVAMTVVGGRVKHRGTGR